MPDTPEQTFRLAEFNALRTELMDRSKEQVSLESQMVLGSAAIYGALGTVTAFAPAVEPFVEFLWWMPPTLLVFGYFRWRANGERIAKIGRYIRSMPFDGWEKFERDAAQADAQAEKTWYWQAIRRGWLIAMAVTTLAAVDRTVYPVLGFLPNPPPVEAVIPPTGQPPAQHPPGASG